MKVNISLVSLLVSVSDQACVTTNNSPCIFPFRHKNITHVGCTLDHSGDSLAWCSTKVDQAGNHVSGQSAFGPCVESCPRDVVCRVLKVKDKDEDFASGLFVFDEIVHNSKPVYENKEKGQGHLLQLFYQRIVRYLS